MIDGDHFRMCIIDAMLPIHFRSPCYVAAPNNNNKKLGFVLRYMNIMRPNSEKFSLSDLDEYLTILHTPYVQYLATIQSWHATGAYQLKRPTVYTTALRDAIIRLEGIIQAAPVAMRSDQTITCAATQIASLRKSDFIKRAA
jgi:hypothetical protein